ncbi:hypothetical protein [Sphingomonas sp. CDS-1]|nr:hypothetical protein [Sphingomonas sp. CDS-1]
MHSGYGFLSENPDFAEARAGGDQVHRPVARHDVLPRR